MKKLIHIILLPLLVTGISLSCKKNSTPAAADYSASIKDKTWWGVFAYTGKVPEYYSLHFNADNTFIWSEYAGDSPGKWSLTDKQVTLSFNANSAQIKADISNDNTQLINLSVNNVLFVVNSCDLVANPSIALDNTTWTGSTSIALSIFVTKFNPGFLVEINNNFNIKSYNYSRSTSGGAFRIIGAPYFGVITSDNTMKGTYVPNASTTIAWQTKK